MRVASRVGAVIAAAVGGVAAGQPVVYRLDSSSGLVEQFCLAPCLCPYHQVVGDVTGTFVLTLDHQDPLYRYFTVTDVAWVAVLAGVPTPIVGSGTYQIGGEVAIQQRLQLDLVVGGDVVHHYDSGLVVGSVEHPFPQIVVGAAAAWTCRENDLSIGAAPDTGPPCYANCDGSTVQPVLNVNDFVCFLNRYVAGEPYANCDGSTTPPVLNVNDFVCFEQRYAAGCR